MTSKTLLLACLAALLAVAAPALSQGHSHGSDDGHDHDTGVEPPPLIPQNGTYEMPFPLAGIMVYHCHPHPTMTGVVRVSATDPAAKDVVNVTIQDYAFTPREIVVKPGGRVNWTNLDADAHSIALSSFRAGEPFLRTETKETPGPTAVAALAVLGLAAVALLRRRGGA